MFPLGSVLLPSVVLPLHVFEPRYRQLMRDCLDGERAPEFGVVLIERGSEVGGGETRYDVGTVARIVEAQEFPDGRWALGAIGTRRLRVTRWLDDDPYPRAEVEDWEDPAPDTDLQGLLDPVVATLRRVLATRAELGQPAAPATQELSDDPVLASYQIVALAPFGPADQQALLAIERTENRLTRVAELLAEEEVFLAECLRLPPAKG